LRRAAILLVYAALVLLQAAPLSAMWSRDAREVASQEDVETTDGDEPALAELGSQRALRRALGQTYALTALPTPTASDQGAVGLCRAAIGRAGNHNGHGGHLRR
jgi:hypothetical protein